MKILLAIAIAVASLAWTLGGGAARAQDPAPSAPNMTANMQAEMERQLYVGMVSLKEHCKQSEPTQAAAIEARWTKDTADVPAELKAFAATPEFSTKVGERKKALADSTKAPSGASELKSACGKLGATP